MIRITYLTGACSFEQIRGGIPSGSALIFGVFGRFLGRFVCQLYVAQADRLSFGMQYRPVNCVFEFPHVARPGLLFEKLHRLAPNREWSTSLNLLNLPKEIPHKIQDILGMFCELRRF